MIKVIIIDDEALARDVIKHYLKPYQDIQVIAECVDGFEGLKAIAEYRPDLIFLDVQMPKISGFEMLELLEYHPSIIFTTAFDEYAIKAFEVNAIDYLLKPIDQVRFNHSMTKLKESDKSQVTNLLNDITLSSNVHNKIVVKKGTAIKVFSANQINYIEADDDYVKISTDEGTFQKNKTMTFFEQTLDSTAFIRIHRSYIINLAQVDRIELKEKDSYIVLLKCGIWLPISKTGYAKLKTVLGL